MNDIIKYAIIIISSYLLGSLNWSLIISHLIFHKDVREEGSGNAGFSNSIRVLGVKWGVVVAFGDFVKGIGAVLLGMSLLDEMGGLVGGICVMLGHVFPLFFNFRGGKAVLTALAVVIIWDWQAALIALGVFAIMLAITRFVSVGSMSAAASLPLSSWLLLHRSTEFCLIMAALAVAIIILHRKNIVRLLNGTEYQPKPGFNKNQQ